MKRLPAAARRNQILDVAQEVFATKGFHETSMEDIADQAGITKPVIYQHFKSKRELYIELVKRMGAGLLKVLEAEAGSASTPYEMVRSGFRAYFSFVRTHPYAYMMLFGRGADGSEELSDVIATLQDAFAAKVAEYIAAGVSDEHRSQLAYAIVGLAEVTGRRWISSRSSDLELTVEEADLMAKRLADLAWAGLRALPTAAPELTSPNHREN